MTVRRALQLKSFRPFLVVIALTICTSVVVAVTVDPSLTGKASVRPIFPDQIDEWVGEEMRFCQNHKCRKAWQLSKLNGEMVCPVCKAEVHVMAIAERGMLPRDTVLLKKEYRHPSGAQVYVSIVMSSAERASIHRPERCLVGQDNLITDQYNLDVPLEGRENLEVRVLNLFNKRRDRTGAVISEYLSYYAYWFVGNKRETSSHWMRMFYMASDRILHNVAHRWSYISVAGFRHDDSKEHHEQIKAFVQKIYPGMMVDPDREG
ncbi:MAG: exosortase-associated EpsI family protein [Verrucomicrobiota bacterium]